MSEITRTERNDLAALARKRARVSKAALKARAAEQKSQVEQALDHRFIREDEGWDEVIREANEMLEKANEKIRAVCDERGVPRDMQPYLAQGWVSRGRNSVREERTDMRRKAAAEIDARLKAAEHQVDEATLEVETSLLADGLTTGAAAKFLESMPAAEDLLPAAVADIPGLLERRNG